MILCSSVESFLVYISELLALVFETRPEMLKSKQSVSVEFVVEHTATNDLIPALVEKRVMDLSYKGMNDLCAYTEKELGFRLFLDEGKLRKAVRFMDMRNVIVHNRAKVNIQLIQRQPEFKDALGTTLTLDTEDVSDLAAFLVEAATDIDARAIRTFSIKTTTRPSVTPRAVDSLG
jgi:hypothetical protein